MKSLVILLPLILASVASADIVTLTNGTVVEGTINRTAEGYLVTSANGTETLVPFDQVAGFKATGGAPTPAMGESSLNSLRRATANMDDLRQIINRYQAFIAQNAGSPAAADAGKDLAQWQERRDKKMVKAGVNWVTPEQFEKLKALTSQTSAKVAPMISAGRLKEASTEIDRALAISPTDADLQYLKGLIAYKQAQLPIARNAFQAAAQSAPDHGPSHNNAGVTLAKTHSAMPSLAEFEKAMEALPNDQTILDNVAEVLHALPVANQNSAITKHVVELFTAQDAVLQKKMAESGLHRWGSKWLGQTDYAAIQQQVKEQKDKLESIKKQFDDINLRLIQIQKQITDDQVLMQQMTTNNFMQDARGNMVQLPPPPRYYDLQRDQVALASEHDQKINEQTALKRTYQHAASHVIEGTYTGTLTIFEADSMPSAPPRAATQPSAPAATPGQQAATPGAIPPGSTSKPPNAPGPGVPPHPKGPGDY